MSQIDRILRGAAWTDGCIIPDGEDVEATHERRRVVHRSLAERMWGTVPDGLILCHTCGNEGCINPQHLALAPCIGVGGKSHAVNGNRKEVAYRNERPFVSPRAIHILRQRVGNKS